MSIRNPDNTLPYAVDRNLVGALACISSATGHAIGFGPFEGRCPFNACCSKATNRFDSAAAPSVSRSP